MSLDFSNQNLRGRSFKYQNLEGANFSYADIRGANFTGANLKGANFSHATAGLSYYWKIKLLIFSYLISILSGFFSTTAGITAVKRLSSSNIETFRFLPSVIILAVSIVFLITLFSKKLTPNSKTTIANLIAIILALTGSLVGATSGLIAVIEVGANVSSLALIGIAIIVLSQALTTGISLTRFVAGVVAGSGSGYLVVILAVSGAVLGALIIDKDFLPMSVIIAALAALLGNYCGQGALAENPTWAFTRTVGIYLTSQAGTNFHSADLTDANFTHATLKTTNLTGATLTRTCYLQTKKLNFANVQKTYLENLQIRKLLISGIGETQNFDNFSLEGINFQGAKLADATFIGAKLNYANLQDADLSRAKLVQTQLDGTNFTGATLTGAFVEDWGITTDTKFDEVRCEYVYMRLPTKDNPDPHRKPDNRQEVFADGEFGDFIKPIFDTLDLYHNQGVDPRAIAISFKQLAENHPEADLRIVGMEVKGEDNFKLRAKTAATASKSELSAEYFDTYNQIKALAEQEVRALMAQTDSRISSLENMIQTALQRPSFYVQTYQNYGDTMPEAPKKVSNFNLQNAQFGGGLVDAETVTANQIGGSITNYTPEQKQNLANAAADIQQLLNQLGQTYSTNTPLEKQIVVTEALKQIESNPNLKARVIGALKSGGTEALKELLDHPVVNVLLAALEGWQEAE